MTPRIALTPHRLAATYECLRTFPPFTRMRLPAAGALKFKVTRDKTERGHYNRYVRTDEHWIGISSACVGHLDTLLMVMAHEMIHLHQALAKTETPNTQHNAQFHRLARRVCKIYGWDYTVFV